MGAMSFGTDGWRAKIADEFTFENVKIVAQAIAKHMLREKKSPRLVIGYDCRFLSEEFASAIAGVCSANGIEVIVSEDVSPTPVTAFAVKDMQADGAVMLTASHNPSDYHGIKFIPDYAGPATKEITASIEKGIADLLEGRDAVPEPSGASVRKQDISVGYLSHVPDLIDFDRIKKSGLPIAADALYGAAINIFPELLTKATDSWMVIHDYRDTLFGGGLPDPSKERLAELRSVVLNEGAGIGLGVDGDADRIGIIADDGGFMAANEIIALLLVHLVKNKGTKGKAVRTVATTHLIDRIAKDLGVEVVETPVGFKYVGAEMRKGDVIIGGEESGGLSIGGHIPEKDGLLAGLLLTEMIAYEEKPLSVLRKNITDMYGQFYNKRLDLAIPLEQKERILANLTASQPKEIGGLDVESVNLMDGVKMSFYGGAWVLIRPSGTEPLIRVYLEARSAKELATIEQGAKHLLETSA